jgi:hypothetical protein
VVQNIPSSVVVYPLIYIKTSPFHMRRAIIVQLSLFIGHLKKKNIETLPKGT